jgi:hypothetical protein
MYDKLLLLKKDGTLKNLVQTGLMSAKVFTYLEIFMWVDAKQKATNNNLSNIVSDAEVAFGVSRPTIWRALKIIRSSESE